MKHFPLKPSKRTIFFATTALLFFSLSSCSLVQFAAKKYTKKHNPERYPAKVVMLDKKVYEGTVALPDAADEEVRIIGEQVGVNETVLKSETVDYIEFWRPDAPEHKHKFVYTRAWTNKLFSSKKQLTKKMFWLYSPFESPKLKAFLGAPEYAINQKDNKVRLIGYAQSAPNGGSIQPSFNVYLQKAGDEYPTFLALKGGIINEKSVFRKGVVPFLADDPALGGYINDNKLGPNDLEEIVKRYNPENIER